MGRTAKTPPTPAELEQVWALSKTIDETNDAGVFESAMTELEALSARLHPAKGFGLETLSREVVLAVQDIDKCCRIQNELLCKGIITTRVEGNFSLCLLAHPETSVSRLVELVLREFDAPNDATI